MRPHGSRVLILAYGNPGRRDDGLGPALAAALEALALPGVTIDVDYQLTVENAAAVAQHDAVVFIDADCRGPAPFSFRRIAPESSVSFSSHSVLPPGVLGLAQTLFGAAPPGYLLGIRGYEFNEFGEGLSLRAQANLAAARRFFEPMLRARTLDEGAAAADPGAPGVPAVAASFGDDPCKTASL